MDNNIAKYMVPWDELDFSLLSLNETEHSRHRSNNRLRNKMGYYSDEDSDKSYNFDTNDDTDSSCTEVEVSRKMCFICNIEVPEIYMKKHIKSDKHEMFLTITNIAIERSKKQIKQNDPERNLKYNPSTYFCEICVSVVNIKNKSNHIISESHMNALKKECIIKDLINVYTNINEYKRDDIQLNLEPKMKKSDTRSHKFDSSKVKTNTDVFTEVIHNVKPIDNDYLIIEIYNYALKIKMDDYHGLILLTKHRYKCMLCMDTFKKKKKHISSSKHIDKISLPIKDRNCIRKLNSYKMHCILCNELIENNDEHIIGDEHKDRLKCSMVEEEDGSLKKEEFIIKEVGDLERKVKRKKHSSSEKINIKLKSCFCHICNTSVPECFLKHHLNSSKHKMYLKIATVALNRVNKNLNQNISIPSPNKSLYFCEVCVSVFGNKSRHIQSNSHKVAVKKEKMFKTLVQLYIDDDLSTDVESDTQKESIENEREIDEGNNDEKSLNEFNKPNTKDNEITEDYLHILNTSTVDSHILKRMDEKFYIIETKDGNQIKVERSNYHSFKKIGKRKYECQLCSTVCQKKGLHILTEIHMKNICSPIRNKHCVREVNSTITHCILCNELIQSYLLHTVCERKHAEQLRNSILNSDDETSKEKEVDIEEKTADVNETKGDTLSEMYNENKKEINNYDLNVYDGSVYGSLNIQKQKDDKVPTIKNIVSQSNQNNGSSKSIQMENIHPYSFLIKKTVNGKLCNVCKVPVPDTTKNIIEHLNGSKHNEVVTKLLDCNGLKMINDKFYCEFCDTYIMIGIQFDHININIHKDNVQKRETKSAVDNIEAMKAVEINSNENIDETTTNYEIIKPLLTETVTPTVETKIKNDKTDVKNEPTTTNVIDDELVINPFIMEMTANVNEVVCKICEVTLPLRKNNVEEHLDGKRHKINETELFEKNKFTIIDSRIYCELCCIDVTNGMHYEHLESFFHKAKMTFFNSDISNNTTKKSFDTTVKWMQMVINYVIELTPNANEVLCKICKVKVSSNEIGVKEHFKDKRHTNNESKLYKRNRIRILNSRFYCDLCNTSIIDGRVYVHIESLHHKVNMEKEITNLTTVESFYMDTIWTDVKDITNKKSQLSNASSKDKYYGIVHNKAHVLRCTLCEVDVPDSVQTLKMHVEGTKHNAKLKKMFPNQNTQT